MKRIEMLSYYFLPSTSTSFIPPIARDGVDSPKKDRLFGTLSANKGDDLAGVDQHPFPTGSNPEPVDQPASLTIDILIHQLRCLRGGIMIAQIQTMALAQAPKLLL